MSTGVYRAPWRPAPRTVRWVPGAPVNLVEVGFASVGDDASTFGLEYSPATIGFASVGSDLSVFSGLSVVEPPEVVPTTLGDELFAGLWPIHEERWSRG